MNLKKIVMSAALLLGAATVQAQQMPPVPADPAVRTGRLDNGMTYYLRHNNWPEHRAEFYIAQRVGSIQENDDQRGLAHFLEHMAFNGSKHFKGNELLQWCEKVGIKFGADLNAYTSIDRTVYNISNVPTTRQSVLDSCLLILYDWADGLLLEEAEIQKERGVIHEEWRLRTSAQMRMLERDLPALYPGSKYGHRMPIGLMEIIDNFEPQFLRDYYEKWYRPDNQALIIVGDIDVDRTEQQIRDLFSQIAAPGPDAARVEEEAVPDNDKPIVVVDKDKEMAMSLVSFMVKSDPLPRPLRSTVAGLMTSYITTAATSMLNDRLQETAQKADCPFVSAGASYGTYLLSSPKDNFSLDVVAKEGQTTEAALTAAIIEARRAAEFGFLSTEYQRFKDNYMAQLDKQLENKDKQRNSFYVNQCVQHFLDGEAMPDIETQHQLMSQVLPMLPLDAVNMAMKEMLPQNDSNVVILNFNQERPDAQYPTEATLLAALAAARAAEVSPFVDNVKNEPLIARLPKAGKVKKQEQFSFDTKKLTLSNGVVVYLKQTDYKKDQVLLAGEGSGGSNLYGPADYANIRFFDDAIEASGLGAFSHTELEKALAGKVASMSLSMGSNHLTLNGSSTPKDVETMLQLLYLYFGQVSRDDESYQNSVKGSELQLKNAFMQPEMVFSDSLNQRMNAFNPRYQMSHPGDPTAASYDRILDIYAERMKGARGWTFTIVGNYDEQTLLPLICQYIASLPTKNKEVKPTKLNTDFTGRQVCSFRREMETPKAVAAMVWRSEAIPFTLENSVRASMAGQVLQAIYLEKIREEASAAYTVMAQSQLSRNDFGTDAVLVGYVPMKPEKQQEAVSLLRSLAQDMQQGFDKERLDKVKEYMLKQIDNNAKTNGFWLGTIGTMRKYGVDTYTDYKRLVEAQTPETVSAYVRQLFQAGNALEVIMLPQTEN
ncbi:MAG: insulinase family protein [Prevotella sp.]|nr:insulinase family protein [Prevotella sp.]